MAGQYLFLPLHTAMGTEEIRSAVKQVNKPWKALTFCTQNIHYVLANFRSGLSYQKKEKNVEKQTSFLADMLLRPEGLTLLGWVLLTIPGTGAGGGSLLGWALLTIPGTEGGSLLGWVLLTIPGTGGGGG